MAEGLIASVAGTSIKAVFFKKDDVKKILGQKKVSLHDYHQVRKKMKAFLNFYYFLGQRDEYGQTVYKLLDDLITDMGDLNDELTNDVLQGRSKETNKMKFPEEFKLAILDFFEQADFSRP